MDYNKLYHLTKENLFTDLLLTLKDDTTEIIINVNKNILYSSCIYFEKLLMNFKEQTLNNITIQVPNANICYDIIMLFYHKKLIQQIILFGNINWNLLNVMIFLY